MRTRLQEWLLDELGWAIPVPGSLTLTIVAILIGIRLAVSEGRRHQIAPDLLISNMTWLLAFGFVGSRVVFWAEHSTPSDIPRLLSFWEGGLSLYGGFLGVTLGILLTNRLGDREWLATAESCAPALAAGLFVGRLGCFLNGCDFGIPTTLPWGVQYPSESPAYQLHLQNGLINAGAPLSQPVHPTQLYESAFALLLLAVLWMPMWSALSAGSRVFAWVAAYSLFRFGVEGAREHTSPFVFGTLTVGQSWSVVFFLIGAVALVRLQGDSWKGLLPGWRRAGT